MSVVSLNTGQSTVTIETIHGIGSKLNVTIPETDAEDYRILLNGLDATRKQIADLPEYIDPRLAPDAGTIPRTWWKAEHNALGGWSHRCDVTHPSPTHERLKGRTLAFKDNVSVAGLPITGGTFPELLNGKPEYPISKIDAVVVSRVLQSGGTVYGTATCEHFSMSPISFTSANGTVHNPWLKGYTTGGSSSGSACLVAINQVKAWRKRHGLSSIDDELGEGVDMAVGGDQGGSIRLPAAFTGIYGLKPTHGLVAYSGILSLHPMIDHAGPMASSLTDLTTLLGVLAGYDGLDPRMTPETPLRSNVPDYTKDLSTWIAAKQASGEWTTTAAGKGLRIGVLKEAFAMPGLTEVVRATVYDAIERFRSAGAAVTEVSIPLHSAGPSIWTIATRCGIGTYGLQNQPQALLNYPMPDISPPPLSDASLATLTKHNPAVSNMLINGEFLASHPQGGPALTAKAMTHVSQLRAAYDEALKDVDVLVTPLTPRVAMKHPELDMSVREKMTPAIGLSLNTCPFNCTGHPGLSMPIGWGDAEDGEGKLPIAMQLVGRRFGEAGIFNAAAAWEVGGLGLDSWNGK
ncbi:hypothetical protein AAFC00_002433 [Neodothiora populina]|uniref:Amidase domain-containing protein n=1 Tax=Neodothiora populina TaxID=2781224 RepID=A0ABR3P719_9PEZI